VTLHFAELDSRRAGGRVFDILLEDQVVRRGYEPLQTGFRVAERMRLRTVVSDGLLDIVLVSGSGAPALAALEVERLE
jgi:hypothetical protein